MKFETGRNSFARETVRKALVTGTCSWCGNSRLVKGLESGKVWQYYVDADSARNSGPIKGQFCGIGCANDYHS